MQINWSGEAMAAKNTKNKKMRKVTAKELSNITKILQTN